MTDLSGLRLFHVTTADISLVLLLGPQLRAFADAGMEVTGVSAPGPFVEQLTEWGIHHEPLRHATRSMSLHRDVAALRELERLFRRLAPDIVHTHNPKPGVYGRLAARAAGVPGIVNTVHGLFASPEDSIARRGVVYSLERIASMCSQAELVQNSEDLKKLRQLGIPDDKLVLLGNGVDLTRFQPRRSEDDIARARRELGVDVHSVVAGIVGRLVWQKGFKELFAAAAALRRTCPELVVVVVGPHDTAKGDALTADDTAAARALGNVIFAGHRDDVEVLYPGFDLFVLPSYREGFPRSAMEAAASGLPVVATDIRGCRQAVTHGETGLLVPLHDVEALVRAMRELARDPARRAKMGAAARRKAEEEFDDQEVIRRTLDVYRRIAASPAWRERESRR